MKSPNTKNTNDNKPLLNFFFYKILNTSGKYILRKWKWFYFKWECLVSDSWMCYISTSMGKEFLNFDLWKIFFVDSWKKGNLGFPMRQRLRFKFSLISSTLISILTLLFIFVILKEAVKKSVAFSSPKFLLGFSIRLRIADVCVFFRSRNSAETAYLTFFLFLWKSMAWSNVLEYVGSFLKL